MLNQAITGRTPFESDPPAGIIIKQTTEALPSARKFVPDLPENVEQVLSKALSRETKDRYSDIGASIEALQGLLSGAATTAPVAVTVITQAPVAEAPPTIAAPRQELNQALRLAEEPAVEPSAKPSNIPETREAPVVPMPPTRAEQRPRRRWGLILGIGALAVICLLALGGGGVALSYFGLPLLEAPTPTSTPPPTSTSQVLPPPVNTPAQTATPTATAMPRCPSKSASSTAPAVTRPSLRMRNLRTWSPLTPSTSTSMR